MLAIVVPQDSFFIIDLALSYTYVYNLISLHYYSIFIITGIYLCSASC